MTNFTSSELILAKTIYGEARGLYAKREGGLAALISIANVVMNRVASQSWFGKTVQDVCLKPYQFSCWNKSDPNRSVIESVGFSDLLFKRCLDVARHVIMGHYPDLTKGSDHYYATWLSPPPFWSKGHTPRIKISDHVFFRLQKEL